MYHRGAALTLVLALWFTMPKSAAGQSDSQPEQQPRGRKTGILGQNYPNPSNPQTRIPFGIVCADGEGGDHVVSVHIYNVLAQLVAVPVLEGPGQAAENLRLPCGNFIAFWDGKVRSTGREAASGTYIYELVVDGERTSKKMYISK